MGLFGLFGSRYERAGFELYGAAVGAARESWFYTELGVPDTLDGRFDLVGAHVFLLIRRLRGLPAPGSALAQAVFDAMFHDMDVNLREMGVGDLSVGKKVRAMWEAFHGRAVAYEAAMAAGDTAALAVALRRNIWRDQGAEDAARRLAEIVLDRDAALARQPLTDLAAGRATFEPLAAEALSATRAA